MHGSNRARELWRAYELKVPVDLMSRAEEKCTSGAEQNCTSRRGIMSSRRVVVC